MRKTRKARRRKLRLQLRKALLVSSVDRIRPRLHRVWLSGDYDFNALKDELHSIKISSGIPQERRRNYLTQAFSYFQKKKLTIFLDRKYGYLPKCMIELSYPGCKYLCDLNMALPYLKISRVEYAIDLFISDQMLIRNAFRTLLRYLWFPNQEKGKIYSKKKPGDTSRKYSLYFKAGKVAIYERGQEKHRRSNGKWPLRKCDRIRIEFRIDNRVLRRHDLNELEKFIKNPKFTLIASRMLNFRVFQKNMTELPSEYEKYRQRDKKGHRGCFQNEYHAGRKRVLNVSQYLKSIPILERFNQDIMEVIKTYNKNWRARYKKSR